MSVRSYCPHCEPEADPIAEALEIQWCGFSQPPSRDGADDGRFAGQPSVGTGFSEAGGLDNILWCAFFHRRRAAVIP